MRPMTQTRCPTNAQMPDRIRPQRAAREDLLRRGRDAQVQEHYRRGMPRAQIRKIYGLTKAQLKSCLRRQCG